MFNPLFKNVKPFGFLLLGSLFLIFFSCKKNQAGAEKLPESVSGYVYAFTSGTVSKTAPIKVHFTQDVVAQDEIGSEAERVISFSPGIEGTASWEDRRTLKFIPKENLFSGTMYVATVILNRIIPDVPRDAKSFQFEFRTREQSARMQVNGIRPASATDLTQQEITGTIVMADAADGEQIESGFAASQSGTNLETEWQHVPSESKHHFIIKNVNRGNIPSSVELTWNGKALNIDKNLERTVEVPALGDFKVLDIETQAGDNQQIVLTFSDPLQKDQDLKGLVKLSGFNGRLRFSIEGNQLFIYPNRQLTSTQKVYAYAGIKNVMGKKMEVVSEWNAVFTSVKPQVKLVGRGVIMPDSDGLIFPFEAVSLNAVEVEVFKIFNNNILQFLQSNELSGQYQLQRVGRIVLQQKVDLATLSNEANYGEMTRYALDLSRLMETDPNAIYQVRIGFRPEYSEYPCGEDDNETTTEIADVFDEAGEIKSIMDSYYGINGYYDDYEYNHRENPCYPAYFNSRNFVSRNVVASNLGIIAKTGKNKETFVAISDLRTTEPVAGALVEFYDYQQQLLKSVKADGDGIVKTVLDRPAFVVIAKRAQDHGYLKVSDGNALQVSRFDVAGAQPQKGLKGYLYGERGVWRPGDSIYLNFILEDIANRLPNNHPITFEFYDPRGQLQEKRVTSEQVENIYSLALATSTDAPTGNWQAKVKVGGATFNKNIKVETVKPNRLKINLDFGAEELDETVTGNLQVNWLHGAPAQRLETKVEVQVRAVNTTFQKYPDFEFDDPARSIESEPRTIFEEQVDGNGKASFTTTIYKGDNAPGKMQASFKTRVFEKGGDFSINSFTKAYHPYSSYAGIRIPKNKYKRKRLEVNKKSNLEFVVLDKNGNPLANQDLKIGLYRTEWRWWWDRGSNRVSRYNSTNHFDALQTINVSTNSRGQADWSVSVDNWGRYLVRVCNEKTGQCSGDFFYAGYPYYNDDSQNRSEAAIMAFSSNQEKYKVGDDIELTVPAGDVGRVLITLENGTEVIESRWADAQKGDNTYRFTATQAMSPTIYAHVSLVQPHAQIDNDLPIRMYGIIPLTVDDPSTNLQPSLEMPNELKPEQTITVKVSETNGQAMAYTVAMVDDGLLDLTNFKTPDPHSVFYAREALGVKTWDVYDQVLGAYGGELERILSIGGDGEVSPGEAEKSANRFKPVVKHIGPFYLPKGGSKSHQITIPNYVGSVRTMVVAANSEGAYGATEKTTSVKKPLMILPTLPRVLGPGETLTLPVNVFAMDKKVKDVSISVSEKSGLVKLTDGANRSLAFAKTGDQIAEFALQVSEDVGVANFTVTAKGGGETATQDIEILVRNPNPYLTNVQEKVLEAGEQWETTFESVGMYGTNSGILEVSNIPPINLGKRLNYLLRYPYGCIEQTTSSGFPQLYVDRLLELTPEQKERIPKNIQATINRLVMFQNTDGGFTYWPGGNYVSAWANNYAGHFLLEAEKLGYNVSDNLLESWKGFQQKAANIWTPDLDRYGYSNYEDHTQAYRLYTLALAGSPALGAMNRLREKTDLSVQARWRLAAAYAQAGKPDVAKQLIANTTTEIKDYRELSYTYGSQLRDQAMILETLILLDNRDRAAQMIRDVASSLSGERWLSTQETAYSLLAIGKFVGDNTTGEQLAFKYQLGGQRNVNAGSQSPIFQVEVPVDDMGTKNVAVQNPTNAPLFARLLLTGQPLTGKETEASNNLKISVNYTNNNGDEIDVSRLPQGTDFVAEVTVSHPGQRLITYEEMALAQVFPSGWEITNARMDDFENAVESARPEYQDIRDDRVFTHFDIQQNTKQTYRIQLNAAYQGRFYLPATNCEAMYDNSINARVPGQWVQVVSPSEI